MTPDKLLKSLSDPTRLRIVLLLSRKPTPEICVCDLIGVLDMEQPKISRHLAVLRKNDVVTSQKRGQWVYYTISSTLPLWAQSILDNLIVGSRELEQFEADTNALTHTQTICEQPQS